MRPFEILLTLTLLVRPWIHHRGSRWLNFLPGAAALFQLLFEGYRWQMLPLYLLAAFSALIAAFRAPPHQAGRKRLIAATAANLLTLLAAALPFLLPIPRPFAPTGPYPIGTHTLHLVDESRSDPYAPNPDSSREFLAQVWYPAVEIGRPEPAPWMPGAEIIAPAVAEWIGLPTWFLDHLVYARTDAYPDLPAADDGPWPVIFFSHGFGGFRAQNTFQVQELASRGYVVVGLEHTYASVTTIFPDGRVAPTSPDALPSGLSDADYEAAAERLLEQWTADLQFTLATLDAMNTDPDGWLSGALDLSKLGIMGHSTGGGAAFQFCSAEPLCAAGLGMDPWLLPVRDQVLEDGLEQPFLVLFSESWPSEENLAFHDILADGYPGELSTLTILGADHYDFSDLPQVSPLSPYLGVKGPIDGDTMLTIVNAYSVDFFDAVLKGAARGLPYAGDSPYPEVVFRAPED